jgi:hypothetical protein
MVNSTPPEASQQPSADAVADAASAARSARIAAKAAIAAAVIGVAGIIIGGFMSAGASDRAAEKTANSTLESVKVQLAGETDKSRAEFLRTQQQVLYSKVITAEQALRDAEGQYDNAVYLYLVRRGPKPSMKKLNAAYERWHNYDASIYTIGSTDVGKAFDRQNSNHFKLVDEVADILPWYMECVRNPSIARHTTLWSKDRKTVQLRCKERRTRLRNQMQELIFHRSAEDRKEFVKAARHDMGHE